MMNINHSPHVKTTSQQNQTCNSLKKISENKQVNCNWLWSLELTPASATKTINVRSWRTYKQPAVNHQSIPKQAQEKKRTNVCNDNKQPAKERHYKRRKTKITRADVQLYLGK
jgi:hypothetical protein